MRISPLDLEWAVVGAKPKVIERFFIQRALYCGPKVVTKAPVWVDARIDVNTEGCTTHDTALQYIKRLSKANYFPSGTELRVIRRTVTIKTEVV